MFLFLMFLLQLTAATGTEPVFFTVTHGDEVTFACRNSDCQNDSVSTEWLFSHFRSPKSEILFKKPSSGAISRSDRRSFTGNCSLVIKAVTAEDVGIYTCRQNVSGQKDDQSFFLSIIEITEQIISPSFILNCSVLQYEDCRHEVVWSHQGKEGIYSGIGISPPFCFATVTFAMSELHQKFKKSMMCKVTNTYTKEVQLFPFKPSPFGTAGSFGKNPAHQALPHFLRDIIVCVGLAILIMSVVILNIWTKIQENQSQMNKDIELSDKDEDESAEVYENIKKLSASVSLN
ncbi:uncharacterized protein LOC119795920 [Cyprinodon tularosa]|uniref:uncharacterized protein LOC119795920 n=1 Tax=Cyprinodon tularosa TaxID=77115 RepID=UPI0018E249C9|nr:uncharacterized protein LOC119795920 [Cyprinodon tularosa]